ncbi:DUF3500 domain-containing protein [Aquabacterium sp. OR-4]|uniref:DUF3500 domain-containing protein n=1 Tax=Aquabacterium sp. OR-4 TaxID=2978127 RepID=UPI0028C93FD5|nr:DUF3500 domain-containing protein [Aquabacterium sp. OR-4]MDT7838032.1 DUF3500 domain-containing protein [Aquabacterium sp. OR-4]
MFFRFFAWLALCSAGLLAAGGGGSDSSTATSTTDTAPVISSQPASLSVVAGASASFSVVATGSGTLSYQWRKGGSAISGATASSYSLASTGTADAGSFDVVVSNSAGSVTSAVATLTVTGSSGVTAPAISTQPVAQSVSVGASATFSVVASGSTPLSYQWLKDGSAIANATASSYTLASVASSDAGSYSVTVSNSAGSVSSDAASLSVSSASSGSSALTAEVVSLAQAFAATLSSSQQSTVQKSWSLATARQWSNLPAAMVSRNGLAWSSLSSAQQTAARALILKALGSSGNALHLGLQAADDALVSQYGAGSGTYGSGHYYIAFIGTPSNTDFWLLQLTGHHLTFNIAFNGSVKSPTPLFLGVEPKGAFTLNGSSYDPMAAQRTAAADLGATLTGYSAAALSGTYSDLLFGANGSGGIDGTYPKSYPTGTTGRGVAYSALSSTDQAKVQALVRAYVATQATEYADELLAAYLSDSALAATYVAYAGAGNVTSSGSYLRVDGPRVWIEFSVQRGVIVSSDIHFHTIWRDKTGDYGGRF